MYRGRTKVITVGGIKIGGGNPIVVQSMTKTQTTDVKQTVKQIKQLEEVGCELIRVAVPDLDSAYAIRQIKKNIKIPLVADIHFDYRLAIESIKSGADKIRINPGNIGSEERVKLIINEAKKNKVPIRLGLNSGSIKKDKMNLETTMMKTLESYIEMFEKNNFGDIIISAKASDVVSTIKLYHQIAKKYNYPLHLGITESGTKLVGSIKSAIGLGVLLYNGIGDTIRVSLTSDPIDEVIVGYEILKSLNLRNYGIELISCPTCGRCKINLQKIVSSFEKELPSLNIKFFEKPIKVAIMGCEVNGPGEAKNADLGIAFGKGVGLLFAKGKPIKKVRFDNSTEELIKILKSY